MAHELEIVDGQARMFYAVQGGVPWHGLGKPTLNALTSEEAIVEAGQDWEVALGPLYGPNRELLETGHQAIYRLTDGKVLGIAGSGYQTWQNREMFQFTDSLVSDGQARYVTAGVMFGGKKVWMLMQVEQDWTIGDDEYKQYILLSSGHDCATSIRCIPTDVRVVCNNTLQMALAGSNNQIRIFHNAGMQQKLAAARDVMKVTTAAQKRMKIWMEKALQEQMQTRRVDRVARAEEKLFGVMDEATPPIKQYTIEQFRSIWDAESERNGTNAYSFINAVTGFADHRRWYKGDTQQEKAEYRFRSLTEGSGVALKSKAIKILAEVCPNLGMPADIILPAPSVVSAN